MPLPGSRVIPDGWAAHHRPAMDDTLDTPCSIRPPGGTPGTFNPETLEFEGGTAAAAHFTGLCSVEDVPAAERALLSADERIPTVDYLVTLAIDDAPATVVGHIITLGQPPNGGSALVGVELTVESIEKGSREFTRALLCSENQS